MYSILTVSGAVTSTKTQVMFSPLLLFSSTVQPANGPVTFSTGAVSSMTTSCVTPAA